MYLLKWMEIFLSSACAHTWVLLLEWESLASILFLFFVVIGINFEKPFWSKLDDTNVKIFLM